MSNTRHWLRVLEAAALMVLARLLIRFAPFGRWRGWLGQPVTAGPSPAGLKDSLPAESAQIISAVARAALRLPGSRCLPQAISAHKMARRRGINTQLVVGALPGNKRGTLDDLHAWVELDEQIIWGDSGGIHTPLFKLI
ncbi:lasso peptide biosynthesis B2 protein [Altererythrobacter sp. ZODW24]|uniref:lasso peptide biosynthesis B2 protein n=1 Tax=Altererythrobacter sp. ZODW24 TaxID=2185142 RepID=UPI000DF80099|nr:lasso peptide biosynthesis B2 protein [Altererythrobacter sp. ZODW24]